VPRSWTLVRRLHALAAMRNDGWRRAGVIVVFSLGAAVGAFALGARIGGAVEHQARATTLARVPLAQLESVRAGGMITSKRP
jgi:hypothetical protein